MLSLEINKTTCIKCNKCIRICTSSIFYANEEDKSIQIRNLNTCISCGHCAAVCPTASIAHSLFPADKVHPLDRDMFPSAAQVATLIKGRRSNRAFTSQAVPKEYIDEIVQAAYRCPTASNEQELSYTVVTDPEVLHLLSQSTIEVFSSLLNLLNPIKPLVGLFMPEIKELIPQFIGLKKQFDNGNDLILRKAKAVILIHSPKNARFGRQDANLAYQNASLMAESLGVAHFYTGFVCSSIDNDPKKRINKALGIDGRIHAGMALGMPAFRFENYIDRKPIRLRWI